MLPVVVAEVNRWITPRSASNTDLASTTPIGFDPETVPPVPSEHSPRRRVRRARELGSFRPDGLETAGSCNLAYVVDAARDLNAVGLLYFASYSGVVDWSLWQASRSWGLSDGVFLDRIVLDQELLYLGNADAGSTLDIAVQRWRGHHTEVVDVTISLHSDRTPLCIATLTLQPPEMT